MSWYRAPLLLIILVVCQVTCPPAHTRGHAPKPSGSVANGAFGGDPKDDIVMWRVSQNVGATEKPSTAKPTTEKATTVKPTTEKSTTEEPTTEAPTTAEPTTVMPTTEKPTTEEPTTKEPTTETPKTEEPTTKEPTTVEATTIKPTTEEASTKVPTTEVITTTEELTTKEATTEKATTEVVPTTEPSTEASTVEPTTERVTTEEVTTKGSITEEPTTSPPVMPSSDATTDLPTGTLYQANARKFDERLPNGTLISTLGKAYKVYPGQTDWSRIVANENGLYVLHPVQSKKQNAMFDPYTIGQVLGYIYEKEEFGDKKTTWRKVYNRVDG